MKLEGSCFLACDELKVCQANAALLANSWGGSMTRSLLVIPLMFLLAACETDFQRCFDAEFSKLQSGLLVEGSAVAWIKELQSLGDPQYDDNSPSGMDPVWLEKYFSVQSGANSWIWSSPATHDNYIKALEEELASLDSGGDGYVIQLKFFKEEVVPIAEEDVRSEESLFEEATEICHSRGIY